ncbi:gamma-glutamyltransferase [Shewanella olleyana]|uniref:gamma-glutamyltransferase n=1 Tax=Shewanella olleyana TaxID=135626 RepID=UPI00200F4DA5|nr:gamma-glutamyltransferase [Shewanella olleyana]MCL1068488.1 gamma-glutamyltransferase [Shewanella olleyana]
MNHLNTSQTMRLSLFIVSLFCFFTTIVKANSLPIQPTTTGKSFMVSATNPYVSNAGYQVLEQKGNAIDAMVAMQMVMTVVEPDMTGIGGGTFALYFNNQAKQFHAFDGRETAPASATADMFMSKNGAIDNNKVLGPRSVAIPGTLKLLYQVHQQHGQLPWNQLIQPAIELAIHGYAMNSYTHDIVVREQTRLQRDPEIKALYWDAGIIKPTGSLMKNPALAQTLKQIAKQGDDYLYQGELGERIVQTVNQRLDDNQPKLSMADFNNYQIKQRDIVKTQYHGNQIVSFGYPSSGGTMVAQSLELLAPYQLSKMKSTDAEPWRLMTEAMRITQADRVAYAGDPDYVDVPSQQLLNKSYIDKRRKLIPETGVMVEQPSAGKLMAHVPPSDSSLEGRDTGHISIVDSQGNAIAMTSTVGTGMGSGVMVDGLILNAQMDNFTHTPMVDGKSAQNAIAPGKRPRSATTPLMVLDSQAQLRLVIGSPGSGQIPGYVLKTLVGILDWDLPAQDAIDLPNIQYGTKIDRTKSQNSTGLLVEKKTFAEMLVPEFIDYGYPVHVLPMVSGLNAIEIKDNQVIGASDRRRASSSMGK